MQAADRREDARATTDLVVACCVIFVLQKLTHGGLDSLFALSGGGLGAGRFWELLTYQFLHGNELHLLVNMLGLWFAGRELEAVLGTRRYLAIYFTGGVVGGLIQVLIYPNLPLIGASASVCAVLLALVTLFPRFPITALIFFVLPLRMKARYLGLIMVLGAVGFWVSGVQQNVGHAAHLGGFLTGWLFGLYFRRDYGSLGGGGMSFTPKPPPFWPAPEGPRVYEGQFEVVSNGGAKTIDDVLEKILHEGIDSLTREERRILESSRRPRR